MNVLSLFDGMSCGRIALENCGVKVDKYFAAEIDKHAIKVSTANYPDIVQIGDVTKASYKDGVLSTENGNFAVDKIDLLIGGSPCQGFSMAGKMLAFDDPRSMLYVHYERLLAEIRVNNPDVKFLLENVKMKQEYKDVITGRLGVSPIAINSHLVSAQNRYRLYWTNIEGVDIPKDCEIYLKDVLQDEVDEKYFIKDGRLKWLQNFGEIGSQDGKLTFNPHATHCIAGYVTGKPRIDDDKMLSRNIRQGNRVYSVEGKSPTLTQGGNLAGSSVLIIQWPHGTNKGGLRALDGKTPSMTVSSWEANNLLLNEGMVRKLTPEECETLQTVPKGYTKFVSDSQRYKVLGNGWTVKVIEQFFSKL